MTRSRCPLRAAFRPIYLLVLSLLGAVQANAIEPLVHEDRSVTFAIQAPEADRVQIDVKGRTNRENDGKPHDLEKGNDGVWRLRTQPLDPGFHYYFVLINGFRCADSSNPLYFGWGRPTNGVEIPDPHLDCYVPRQVPRGELHVRPYYSELTHGWREAYVYTPPSYGKAENQKFPTLYLQHGAGENQTSWTRQGRAHVILDNLIAEQKCREMVVVMDRGYAYGRENSSQGRRNNLFSEVLIRELMPLVESQYRVIPNRWFRAIAGLSMGGGQAVQIGLSHLDHFAYLGCFSGAIRSLKTETEARVFPEPSTINQNLKLFWIGCGQEDFVFERANKFRDELEAAGIDHIFHEHPGTHEWQAWRLHLSLFAPQLFQN